MAKRRFAWRGVNRQGEIQSGVLHAHTSEEVSHVLKQQRIRVTRIQRQFHLPSWLQLKTPPRVSARDITQFTRQLATLLHAGAPLLQAFEILNRGEGNAALKTLIRELRTQVEGCAALNQALRQHAAFDALYCNLVAVGELAGMLDTMLERLAHHLEKLEALRTPIRSALIYPRAAWPLQALCWC